MKKSLAEELKEARETLEIINKTLDSNVEAMDKICEGFEVIAGQFKEYVELKGELKELQVMFETMEKVFPIHRDFVRRWELEARKLKRVQDTVSRKEWAEVLK